jgi:hypothetical protein
MSLFDAATPKAVELKGSTSVAAPQYLTNYLTQLAQAGQGALGAQSPTGALLKPYTGDELIAARPKNLTDLYKDAPTTLSRYEDPLDEASTALEDAATGVSAADITAFNDPYQKNVIAEMTRQSALNTQQNLLPALRGAFAGSGGFGSQRYAGAAGQALSNVQNDLTGQQAKFSSEGYKSALEAALRDRGYDISAGQALSGLGQIEAQAATTGVKALGDVGIQELSYDQSKLEAPLTRAQNVAQILRGYTYPTTTTETKDALPSAYPPSPLQQIGSLGTLVAAGSGKDGLFTSGIQLGKDIFAGLKNYLPEPDPTIPGSIPRTPDEIKTSDDLGSFPG